MTKRAERIIRTAENVEFHVMRRVNVGDEWTLWLVLPTLAAADRAAEVIRTNGVYASVWTVSKS